jgi:hypothetical protein
VQHKTRLCKTQQDKIYWTEIGESAGHDIGPPIPIILLGIWAFSNIHTTNIKYTGYTQNNDAVSKVNKKLFLTLHGHNIHRQERQLSKFLMRYQQFASHAYYGAAGPVSRIALQQEKAFWVLRFEVSRSDYSAA